MVEKRATIILIEGANLNLINLRPKIYQSKFSNEEIFKKIESLFNLVYFQSNYEGEIVEAIHLIEINRIKEFQNRENENCLNESFIDFFKNIESSEKLSNFYNKIKNENIIGVIINPAAFTHYSIALSDALEILNTPKVEVHLTNIYKREEFRHKSVTVKNVDSIISGAGNFGYYLAAEYLYHLTF
ncbi:type II 3-dehydroquinate dehydratase [bacterium]|nr:type II 3-dehydroquinate dehydratase [bacterium]